MKYLSIFCICLLLVSCTFMTIETNQGIPTKLPPKTATSVPEIETLDTLLHTQDYLILGKKPAEIKISKKDEASKYADFEILIGYKDDVILGKNVAYNDVELYRKYHPKTSFAAYKVPVYTDKLAPPDFNTNPDAKRFITRIKEGCAKGINFAGKYTLVTWGCGSPCQSGVIVNRETGKIYDGYGTSLGAEFRKDSKLLISNVAAIDTQTNLIRLCAYCEVSHEIWTGTEFKVIE